MTQAFDTAVAGDIMIAAVRAALDAMGRPDIALEREWLTVTLDEREAVQAVLMVPIGRGLALPLKSMDRDEGPHTVMQQFAEDVFQSLPNVEKARWSLRRYAADTRRAAEAAIADARRDGVNLTLAGIGLRPTYATHMAHSSWKEAADHVLATVLVNGLDFHLNPDVIELVAGMPSDVAGEIADLLDRQRELQDKRSALSRLGATVAVDVVTLRIIFEHDLGFVETLGEVVRAGHMNIDLTMADGSKGHLYLVSSEGVVRSSMHSVGGAFRWTYDCVELPTDPTWGGNDALVGADLAEIAGSELFKDLKVQSVRAYGTEVTELKVDAPTRLFDADKGYFLRDRHAA